MTGTRAQHTASTQSFYIEDDFLSEAQSNSLLRLIQRTETHFQTPKIERQMPGRSLRYRVMDGIYILHHLPELLDLIPSVQAIASIFNKNKIFALDNPSAAINVNITEPSGEYRWHYDRNAITAILYLNSVSGGETELIPNSRIHLGPLKHTFVQRWLDQPLIKRLNTGLAEETVTISPKPGRLMIMQGDRCLHSVKSVEAGEPRYNIIFTFDKHNARFHVDKGLDPYLYSTNPTPGIDPNYVA